MIIILCSRSQLARIQNPYLGWVFIIEPTMSGEKTVREIEHDEFDPKGTLALILVYFGILTVMWIFMYFVEFLGNDLTVIV